MSDLSDLYQQVILDHYKRPRNFRRLDEANRKAEGHNPLCGDEITVYLHLDGDVIKDISFEGAGCAISKASASMMTAALKGRTRGEAETLFEKFHEMVTGRRDGTADPAGLGKLEVFCGVSEFPVRVKCASLAWHTLRAALEGSGERVSTE
ncbi:MAG: SUF system NifU family Fe-S cluster assembly protein [candidate division NC10 bacterium]|nr:SUF system NifU family Fe-S cluster assembly protein [candidate division NC10 bacterium]MBI4840717.1 SUF system NifU family Fe-S cluster assembly protein [candidate division NC10 bacterium]